VDRQELLEIARSERNRAKEQREAGPDDEKGTQPPFQQREPSRR
jgi:hypothetical protein